MNKSTIQENKELGKQRILFRLSDINIYHKSIICFKLAEITNGNELENSKYGQNTGKMSPNCQIGCRLQMDSKSRDFWQDERKRFNLIRNIFIILI